MGGVPTIREFTTFLLRRNFTIAAAPGYRIQAAPVTVCIRTARSQVDFLGDSKDISSFTFPVFCFCFLPQARMSRLLVKRGIYVHTNSHISSICVVTPPRLSVVSPCAPSGNSTMKPSTPNSSLPLSLPETSFNCPL